MQARQLGLSLPRFFLALILASCFTSAVFGINTSPPQENAATANFEALAKSATAAREAGRTDDALRDYKRALEIRADWAEGWWYLGTMEYDQDRYAEAIPAFQKLVQLAPAAGPGWNFLGLCEFETKDYANSLEHLKKGQALGDADDPEISRVAKYHLALLLIRRGDFDQATALLASTFGQNQISAQAKIALGLAILRVPLLREEVDPSRDALLHAAGETAAIGVQRDTAKALESFRTLSKNYPRTPYLHYAYGRALASAARLEEALAEQREEISVSPKSVLPRIEISQLQLRLHHAQEALRAAEEAVQLAPDSAAAHNAMGQALQATGKKEKAAEELAAAEKLSPEKLRPDDRIAQLYALRAAADRIGDAQAVSRNANGISSESFEELSRRAAEAQAAGQTDLAIQNYQQALQMRPEWDDGRWNLAMLCYSAAKYPEAISALKSWGARKPNFGTAWAVMGLSEFEIKDYGNALIHLQRGEELGLGGSAEAVRFAKYHLGVLLIRDGQFENATRILTPAAGPGALAKQIEFALGMALLRMPFLPEQIEASKNYLVQTAGEIAALLQESKYDQAFPKFQFLLKEFPSAPFLHYAYGTAFAALSQYDEAEIQFRREMTISPASELPFLRMASLALKKHQPAEALPFAQSAVKLSPDSGEAHYLLGRAALELGQEETAVRELEMASKLVPGSPEVHFNLAKAYAKAKLMEKAEQERAIFARLNALAEQQRSHSGNQAYGGSHNAADLAPARAEAEEAAAPEHPL
jgi:tetratricopeptide (TPR) repeat protein